MPALKARILHLCDQLFSGKIAQFAAAMNLHPKHFYHSLRSVSGVSAGVVAQIVTYTPVRAEWLLCGTGPMLLKDTSPEADATLHFPPDIRSAHTVFDTSMLGPHAPPRPAFAPPTGLVARNTITAAGRAVYQARVDRKPVIFFLGVDAVGAKISPVVADFVLRGHVTLAALTSPGVPFDVKKFAVPLPTITHMGALSGVGLGEAVGRWAFSDVNKAATRSVIAAATKKTIPVAILTAIGSAPAHFEPALHGAEYGAALGATAYVDMLLFTEAVRRIAGGVFIYAAEPHMASSYFQEAFYACRRFKPAEPVESFTVISLGAEPPDSLRAFSEHYNSPFHFLAGSYPDAAQALLAATDAAYAGVVS